MGRGLNQAMVIGNLGGEPEMRFTPNGKAVTTFSVATNRSWKNDSGNLEEETTWFRVTVWEGLAEVCNKFLKKGSSVFAEGRMHNNSWTGTDGKLHDGMELIANTVLFLGSKDADYVPEKKSLARGIAEQTDPGFAKTMVDELAKDGIKAEIS